MRSRALHRRRFCMLGLAALALAPGRADAGPGDRDAVVAMVDSAVAAIERYGFPEALRHTPSATWVRRDAGLYVFVLDRSGTLLLHADGRMQGRDVSGALDATGKPFIREILDAERPDPKHGIWTSYLWASHATGRIGTKHTYSRAVGDLIVAAGFLAEPV